MLGEIPKTWKQGRRDDTARKDLVRTLREVSELDAGRAVVDLLKHGVSTDSIWEGLFATAAELVLRLPTVVPVHAQTSANAFSLCVPARASRGNTASGALAVGGFHAGLPAPRSATPDPICGSTSWNLSPSLATARMRCATHSPSCRTLAPPALAKHCTTCNTAAVQTRSSPERAGNSLATAGSPTTTSSRRPPWRTIGKWRPPRGGTGFCPLRWHTSQGPQRRRAPFLKRRCSY